VADPFHLVRNVGDALNRLLDSRRWLQPTPTPSPEIAQVRPAAPAASLAEDLRQAPQPTSRKRAIWEVG